MAPRTLLITGANGEIGHGLIADLAEAGEAQIVALDLHPPDEFVRVRCHRIVTGDIVDIALLDNLSATYDFDAVYHLAALLSTKSERQPRLANLRAKQAGKVREDDWCEPRTMYGINKLYCERLGRYYEHYYRQLDATVAPGRLDFRCLRFPGLISAATTPTGGTSDYAPEMLHAAASHRPYACFVREDTRIPFLAMPDAIKALLRLEAAPQEALS